jgi:hypothetical protein
MAKSINQRSDQEFYTNSGDGGLAARALLSTRQRMRKPLSLKAYTVTELENGLM